MAKKKRLSPNQLAEVKSSFAGLKQIAGYTPLKEDFKVSAIQEIDTALDNLLTQESQILAQIADLRDKIADKGSEYVQRMNGASQQVIAQFGDDSPEIQSLGRKRKSDRAPRRQKSGGNTPNG